VCPFDRSKQYGYNCVDKIINKNPSEQPELDLDTKLIPTIEIHIDV